MIEVRNITKIYGKTAVVDDVSLSIPRSAAIAISGPSGSGKTTFLRLLAGLEIPDDGEIFLQGKLVSSKKWVSEPCSRKLGFVFQVPSLWPHLTVAGNILFGLERFSKIAARERVNEILEALSITELKNRYPHEISGGQARRVAIARTLAPKPQIILMDEPLVNLESDLKHHILNYILENFRQTGATLIYVTHDINECAQITDQPLYMSKGKLAEEEVK